jgi:segregation and condensation protein B
VNSLQPVDEFNSCAETIRKFFLLPHPQRIIEAILFSASEPVSSRKLSLLLKRSEKEILSLIESLNSEYERDGHSFRIHRIFSGYQIYTLPEYGEWVKKLFATKKPKLSQAAKEVLSIVALKQPVTKTEIDKIRGVDSTSTLHYLLERKLIKIAGRAKRLGAPFIYKTTDEFLKYFGLQSLEDLPKEEELDSFFNRT